MRSRDAARAALSKLYIYTSAPLGEGVAELGAAAHSGHTTFASLSIVFSRRVFAPGGLLGWSCVHGISPRWEISGQKRNGHLVRKITS